MGTPVSDPGGGQFWAGPEPSAVTAALTALATAYTVAMGRPVTTHRMWLDSADFRLYRSGMALMATAGPDGDERSLELSSPDGATVTAGSDTLGWPRLLAGLPYQLRPRLEPVLGVRALLPVVQVSGTSVTGRLLDVEGKTVLRLVHERPATISGSRGRLSGGLWLIPLRGYAAVGARAGRIAHRAGLVRDDRVGYPAALRAAGIDPDATRPVMEPGLPARVAVARVLVSFLDEMEAAWDGTVTDVDIEFLHDFRVAVRRSRSAVKLLGDVLPPALVAWVTPRVEVARRPHHAVARPRRPPAGAPVAGRLSDQRPARGRGAAGARPDQAARGRAAPAGARLAVGAVRAVARPLAGLAGGAGQPGTGGPCAGPTAAEIGMERLASADRRVLRRGVTDHATPRLPRTCTTCASGPRSCATCWRPSPRCWTRATPAAPSRS